MASIACGINNQFVQSSCAHSRGYEPHNLCHPFLRAGLEAGEKGQYVGGSITSLVIYPIPGSRECHWGVGSGMILPHGQTSFTLEAPSLHRLSIKPSNNVYLYGLEKGGSR